MTVHCFVPRGFEGHLVTVEVDIRRGIPGTDIVGLPGGAVREARERVRTAIRNVDLWYPRDRVIINLVPAGVPKIGASFDLAIAVAVLAASDQLSLDALAAAGESAILALGELQLNGRIRPVAGVLAAVAAAREAGIRTVLLSPENADEAAIAADVAILPVGTLPTAVAALADPDGRVHRPAVESPPQNRRPPSYRTPDFAEMRKSPLIKRVCELAAAGGHSLLLVGSPGVGKSLALSCYPSILPEMPEDVAITATRIHSLAGTLGAHGGLLSLPPVRRPHHSASVQGLIGGGSMVLPGEVSLAHGGALCLDEALEFPPRVLQGLRQPLEEQRVSIVRAGEQYQFPAAFQLLMATNPCPCGYLNSTLGRCLCSEQEIARYWKRLGGALLDRVELRLEVAAVPEAFLPMNRGEPEGVDGGHGDAKRPLGETWGGAEEQSQSGRKAATLAEVEESPQEQPERSREMLTRVSEARARQYHRYGGSTLNAGASYSRLRECVQPEDSAARMLESGGRSLRLSNRGLIQAMRVARTIADLDGAERVDAVAISEALQYRRYAAQWE